MSEIDIEKIKEKILEQHEGDEKQLEVIFSTSSRIIVEAPAGYGKTTTMISRIAYLFASGCIPNPKRILGMTFSVNAALKVKREVAAKLPILIGRENNPDAINDKAVITNYHGFCKGVLKKYGYLLSTILKKDINSFRAIGESEIEKIDSLSTIQSEYIEYLKKLEVDIKNAHMPDDHTIVEYNRIVSCELLPHEYITHNAIILMTIELFRKYPEIQKFYHNYFSLIIIDEFQDTNCIAWLMLEMIISEQTQLLFLGDPLQRIYGFIGAIPDIMLKAKEKYMMEKIELTHNYRFRDNYEMLKLDKNIRANATYYCTPSITQDNVAKLPVIWGFSQKEEAVHIAKKIEEILVGASKVAILFRRRGGSSEIVEEELSRQGIPFFYGMFSDEDSEYISFHQICQECFIHDFDAHKSINKRSLGSFSRKIREKYNNTKSKKINALLDLLDAFIQKVSIDYSDLLPEDKYNLILDVFENRQIKQAMEYVDTQVILSTIHGAKGLEWDYVIICDVARCIFPSYFTCNMCRNKSGALIKSCCCLPKPIPNEFLDTILDEMSVFYVGITRAKKQVFVSASRKRFNKYGKEEDSGFSCMVKLDGIQLINGM